jgi:hypothetical protein
MKLVQIREPADAPFPKLLFSLRFLGSVFKASLEAHPINFVRYTGNTDKQLQATAGRRDSWPRAY